MKLDLHFDNADSKKLLAELDYEFYLKMNFVENSYDQENIEKVYRAHEKESATLRTQSKVSHRQFNYYVESQIRLACKGGSIPSIFKLNEAKEYRILDFAATGKEWAYFDFWKKYESRKITREKVWDIIIKTGSLLGILLTLLTLATFIFHLLHPEKSFK